MAEEIEKEELENQSKSEDAAELETNVQEVEHPPMQASSEPPASEVRASHEEEELVVNDENPMGNSIDSNHLNNLDLLQDVSLNLTVEIGRCEMQFRDILQLGAGSIVELNKLADQPVDIYVNHSKIAEGEVVVIGENFGVRISKLLHPKERSQ